MSVLNDRDVRMFELRMNGATYKQIADDNKLCCSRVRSICVKMQRYIHSRAHREGDIYANEVPGWISSEVNDIMANAEFYRAQLLKYKTSLLR